MKIIVGLGNPGEKYAETRHNAGFTFLDYLKQELDFEEFHEETKFVVALSAGILKEEKVLFAKPLTSMNDSGKAVAQLVQFYKLTPQDILVVHDELDVELGKYKMATDSRSAGHNGVQNIIDALGTQKFTRLRIGISRPVPAENGTCISAHDYVLQKFSDEEEKTLRTLFPELKTQVLVFLGHT